MIRKCIFTGEVANAKGSILPKELLKNESYNWNRWFPTTEEYREELRGRMPTELELEANDTFHKLEDARLKVKFYEEKLTGIQDRIKNGEKSLPTVVIKAEKPSPTPKNTQKQGVKSKRAIKKRKNEEKLAVHEVQEIQTAEKQIKKSLKKGSFW